MYSVYKNIVLSMTHFFFSFFSKFSAQNLYPNIFVITYNYVWTLWPPLWCAILDIDVSARTSENNPPLYAETQLDKGSRFIAHISGWILTGIWHSIVAFIFPCMALLSISNTGQIGGMWVLGLSIYTTALLIVTVKLAIHIPRYTIHHVVSIFFALLIYMAMIYFISISSQSTIDWINIKAQVAFVFSFPTLWMYIALGPIAACLLDTTFHVFSKRRWPEDFQVMQEMEHGWQDNTYVTHHQNYVEQINDFNIEQAIEDDGMNSITNESLSNEAITINTFEEPSNLETNKMALLTSTSSFDNLDWERNINELEIKSSTSNLFENENELMNKKYISSPNRHSKAKFNFVESLRKSFNKRKDKKSIAIKDSAKPFEIVEALGIVGETGFQSGKSPSPWKNLAKRWSLTSAPQSEAPVKIKYSNDLQPKSMIRKMKKKTLKANPAMSRLTRLASTKINISDLNLYFEDEDHSGDPVEHKPQNFLLEPIESPSLPDAYLPHREKNDVDLLTKSHPIEYFNAMELDNRNRTSMNPLDNNRSSISHLGYSSSKPKTPNFVIPTQPLRPSLEENLRPARFSTVDHYSRLTGGPSFQEKTTKVAKNRSDDHIGNNMKQSRGSSFYDDDYDIEYDNDNDNPVSTNRTWNQDKNDDTRNTKKLFYSESRFRNSNYNRNEELDAYNSSCMNPLKTDLKGKLNPPKLRTSHNENLNNFQEFNPPINKEAQSVTNTYEQTNQLTSTESISNEIQPMYRRISVSGHVSSILQPDAVDLLPHESPFADYTIRGLIKENPKLSVSGDLSNETFENNKEYRSIHNESIVEYTKPLQILIPQTSLPTSKSLEPSRNEPMFEMNKIKLQQNSLEHAPKESGQNIIEIVPHESSFADYSKHGIREQPTSKGTHPNSNDELASVYFSENENFVNQNNLQVPLIPIVSNFVVTGRSPWASETGDPSHSITASPILPLVPPLDHSIAMKQPNVDVDTSHIIDSTLTTNTTQRSSITSRVSLYSNVDIPTSRQVLEVIPHRNSKSE